jgi:hypothetical protein
LFACRYCAIFTISQLQPLIKNKLINYVQLSVIPWGNARIGSDGKVRLSSQQPFTWFFVALLSTLHVCQWKRIKSLNWLYIATVYASRKGSVAKWLPGST